MMTRSKAPVCSTCSPAPARLGIEAVSRGRPFALFVDNGAEARALLRNNVEALVSAASPRSIAATPPISAPPHPMEPFSLAFLDPPYGKGLADKALISLRDGGWLTKGALVVVEEAKAGGICGHGRFHGVGAARI